MNSTMLDLAISLIFLFLLLSIVCSAVQELVANALKWRSTTLETGLKSLLSDPKAADQLFAHPVLKGLSRPGWFNKLHKPSYLPTSSVALALLDLAKKAGDEALPDATKKILAIVTQGAATVEEEQKKVEEWFDTSMDRISGWYKRKAHACLWVIGIVVCLILNANSFTLADAFWHNQALREAFASAATKYVQDHPEKPATTTPQQGTPAPADNAQTDGKSAFARLDEVRSQLTIVDLPLGWCKAVQSSTTKKWGTACWPIPAAQAGQFDTQAQYEDAGHVPDPRVVCNWAASNWIVWILGILVSSLAISQGAPFWFDMLQKVANVRLAGNAPDEKKK